MELRPYTPQDCPEMADLFYETVHTVNAADYPREALDAWATGQVDMEQWNASFLAHHTVVAWENGQIVGFGDMDENGYLDRLYVHRAYQRRGVARAICDCLEGSRHCRRFTTHASITARGFFEKRGYSVVKQQTVARLGVEMTNFVMEKPGRLQIVTDLNLPELAVFTQLTQAQLRNRLEPEKGIFIAESPKVIGTALDADCTPLALLMERKHLEGQGKALIERCGDIPVYTGDEELLARLTGYRLTRGILCAMRRPRPRTPADVCKNARRIAVLEGVVDATNVGAIFRAAAALGMDGILLSPACCDPLCRRAVRVSMGTVFQIPWAYLDGWPESGMAVLHALGFRTAAMALTDQSVSIEDPTLCREPRLAVVLGTEGDGLAAKTIAACDYTVRIPMHHGVDSLNVAAAASVAFWQLRARPDAKLP